MPTAEKTVMEAAPETAGLAALMLVAKLIESLEANGALPKGSVAELSEGAAGQLTAQPASPISIAAAITHRTPPMPTYRPSWAES